LRHVQPFRGQREAGRIDDGGESAKKAWIEHFPPWSRSRIGTIIYNHNIVDLNI
jgi:hypothetical protein